MPLIARHRLRHAQRGFTLIELSIVVVIVGVLAVLGILGYRRYVKTAHMAEATNLTNGIRAAQEAYKTEKGVYADVSADTDSFYPAVAPGQFVTQWGGDCKNCKNADVNGWKKLAVHSPDPVIYGYATVAGIGGGNLITTPPPRNFSMQGPSGMATELTATDPYYVTVAWGDTDADGNPCIVLSYSTSGQLVVQSAGE
jgi:type IV pilus assembly protein PilA